MGLNDTRGEVVTATLHTLAELVPLVGPEAVIGTTRRQIFVDSQPRVRVFVCEKEREKEKEREIALFFIA